MTYHKNCSFGVKQLFPLMINYYTQIEIDLKCIPCKTGSNAPIRKTLTCMIYPLKRKIDCT
jgi:hypothetical protein